MRNERCLLKHSPVNRLAFVVCAKRGGVGHEGQKRDREKGLTLSPHLHNPPPPSLFHSSQSSTTFDACYAGYKQAFFLARPYAGTCWGKLIKEPVDTSWANLMGRVADGVLVSPLHSYSQMRFPYLKRRTLYLRHFFAKTKTTNF